MPVSIPHPEYSNARPLWRACRDAVRGQAAIKAGRTLYLPASFATTEPEVYADFLNRAYWLDVAGRTLSALVGMVFRKDAEREIPPPMEQLVENIDGMGQSLDQLGKEIIQNLLETGRHILLVDYPQADEGMDAETESRLGLRPTVASYPAESLINWNTEGINGRQMLTLAVLEETRRKPVQDEFSHDTEKVYRVLRLRDGIYTQSLYSEGGQELVAEYIPKQSGGAPFDHLPLHVMGASNNKPDVDDPPLLGLAHVNISHYQTTANIEEAGWNLGQAMLSLDIGDSEETWFNQVNGGSADAAPKFRFGSRFAFLSKKGKAEIVQTSDSDYNIKLSDRKEAQMVMLGARLVQRGGQAETAEATRINASAEASVLETLVGNASEGLEAALEDCARFVGADPEAVSYSLNRTFWESTLDAQSLQVVIAGYQGGLYDQDSALDMIRSGAIKLRHDVDNEQIINATANALLTDVIE